MASALSEGEKHLCKACKGMARIIPNQERYPTKFEKSKDPYRALARAIVYQQLSGKAAATIFGRVVDLFPGQDFPAPEQLLAATDEQLRGVGLSRQKAAALRDLAQKRLDGIVPQARSLTRLPDDDIVERLVQVRGVGRWTVEMYLIFTLGRPDVLPTDDLGVRKGAERIFKREFTPKELGKFAERWAPWRSIASWHLWRVLDIQTPD